MRFLNQQAEPQLGVGMPASAIAISRRMKWTKLTGICDYTLRLSVRRLAATALRRLRIGNGSAARFIPPGLQIHSRNWQRWDLPGGEVRAIKPDDWPLPPATGYGLAPICTKEYFAWLSAAPAFLGKVFGLIFHRDGCPAGFSVCRVEPSFLGTKARIIHIHAFQPDAAVLRWMLAANVAMAVELGAEFVLIRSTCPVTQAALADLHFQLKERDTVILNWGARAIPQMPVNVTYLRGDDAMIPGLIGS
jgi:hypothetical protein